MTHQFHAGDEVEVQTETMGGLRDETWRGQWRKAKIVQFVKPSHPPHWIVQFHDGSRAVFDAEHIRTDDKIPTKDHLRLGKEIGLLW